MQDVVQVEVSQQCWINSPIAPSCAVISFGYGSMTKENKTVYRTLGLQSCRTSSEPSFHMRSPMPAGYHVPALLALGAAASFSGGGTTTEKIQRNTGLPWLR